MNVSEWGVFRTFFRTTQRVRRRNKIRKSPFFRHNEVSFFKEPERHQTVIIFSSFFLPPLPLLPSETILTLSLSQPLLSFLRCVLKGTFIPQAFLFFCALCPTMNRGTFSTSLCLFFWHICEDPFFSLKGRKTGNCFR